MPTVSQLDCTGRRRSPATLPGYHQGRPPRNRALRSPPDPPTTEEIIAVMRAAGESRAGLRLRAIIVVLWRAGLRISEALALSETDLDRARGSIQIRQGKGGRGREVGLDPWAFEQLDPWRELRRHLPGDGVDRDKPLGDIAIANVRSIVGPSQLADLPPRRGPFIPRSQRTDTTLGLLLSIRSSAPAPNGHLGSRGQP